MESSGLNNEKPEFVSQVGF